MKDTLAAAILFLVTLVIVTLVPQLSLWIGGTLMFLIFLCLTISAVVGIGKNWEIYFWVVFGLVLTFGAGLPPFVSMLVCVACQGGYKRVMS